MLSNRAHKYMQVSYQHGELHPYHPDTNPNGLCDFANAENGAMHEDVIQFLNTKHSFEHTCLGYSEGYTGTLRLRRGMANQLNTSFHPFHPIDSEDITFTAGVTELNETCALLTCDANGSDAIMLGRPNYGSFKRDMTTRGEILQVFVEFGNTDQFNVDCAPIYEQAIDEAKTRGIEVKALLICNPHNPLGRCYTPEALIALMKLCSKRNIHFISDEIYGLSTYERPDRPSEKFVSVLSIDAENYIDLKQVHVLYGMSKDYAAAGMRLGCLITRNQEFTQAARGICRFSSPSHPAMSLAASMLEDRTFLEAFLEKSNATLLRQRLIAEKLFDEAGIDYYRKGNAAFFMWLDLRSFLPLSETDGDGFAAERLLGKRLAENGVLLNTGEGYHSLTPGFFRFLHSLGEPTVREGIRRVVRTCVKGNEV